MRWTNLAAMTALPALFACDRQATRGPVVAGPAVRLSAGAFDTIIVNTRTPTPLSVRAVDAAGRPVAMALVQYERANGADIPVTADGVVTCTSRGDVSVRATLERLSTLVPVRCRPISWLQLPGPIQFVLGDSTLSRPIEMPLAAFDTTLRPVVQLAAMFKTLNRDVATVRGDSIYPRSRGITVAGAWSGLRSAWTGVHVYQRVDSMNSLDTLLRVDPHQRLFAVRIRIKPGERRRQSLPRGDWMLTTLTPEIRDTDRFRLQFENMSCKPNILNDPRRFGCRAERVRRWSYIAG